MDRLFVDAGRGESVGISHVDRSILYSSEIEEELLLEAAEYFIKNPTRLDSLLGNHFGAKRIIEAP